MKAIFALLPLLAATTALADVKGPNGRTVECFCTDSRGSRVELGETICLYVNDRAFMAQCQMSLNMPMWREVGEGCLSSSLPQSKPHLLHPAVDPLGVDAPVVSLRSRPRS
ncbi:MAG: hypothetical protein EX266_14365 [Rhodobacteraceae bacterium]|nr:MAG: hypothetical protein EX266_14365 [Paracoccaceae bacterium]